jgi:pimeloyl-ACP methyl ester carboxylesterase
LGHRSIFKEIAEYLSAHGVVVLRYDKRGVGRSGGVFENYDIDAFVDDGLAAVSYLRTLDGVDPARVGALGISQGGLIVPIMATRDPEIALIIMLAGPGVWGKEFFRLSNVTVARACGYGEDDYVEIGRLYDRFWPIYTREYLSENEVAEAEHILWQISKYMDDATRSAFSLNNIDGYFKFMRSAGLLKWMDHDPSAILRQVQCPVLALNGDRDVQTSSPENLAAIEAALKAGQNPNYEVIELEGLNHAFSRCSTGLPSEYFSPDQRMAPEALHLIGTWIERVTQEQ